jgi:hypothetical protein
MNVTVPKTSRLASSTAGAEVALYLPVKAFLERQGYVVRGEVRGCDLVACRGNEEPVIVELKLRFTEALLAAAKVAELLDRYDLSLTDIEIRDSECEQRPYETYRKKRIPLDGCVGAIANFCDCRVWREKNQLGDARYVFFGLRSDIEVAHYLGRGNR